MVTLKPEGPYIGDNPEPAARTSGAMYFGDL